MKKNIRKVKKYQKPLICLVVMLLMILSFIAGKITNANADETNYEYQSNNIGYDSTSNSLSATNVKDAIDELYSKVGKCPTGQFCSTSVDLVDKLGGRGNFVSAYTYDENSCVTGNECGCIKTKCYENGTCPVGTIIDYLVNNTTIVRFHVLHDNGNTITMQTQKNTLYNIPWYERERSNFQGPVTVLSLLESKTDGWINVNNIFYNRNDTLFIGINDISSNEENTKNINNYCISYSNCGSNQYTYPIRMVKARMIMLQEAVKLGCTTSNITCPKFMYNYSYNSTNYGGTFNDNYVNESGHPTVGYWTMNASGTAYAWYVTSGGGVGNGYFIDDDYLGARAVVVVDK